MNCVGIVVVVAAVVAVIGLATAGAGASAAGAAAAALHQLQEQEQKLQNLKEEVLQVATVSISTSAIKASLSARFTAFGSAASAFVFFVVIEATSSPSAAATK